MDQNIHIPEILAPAGDFAAVRAAVNYGADAVYVGLDQFSARQGAENFGYPQIETVFDYAHARNRKVYVAMNTLLKDEELETAVDLCVKTYLLGADGMIVQDLGFIKLLRTYYPQIPLHASTQMTITDAAGVRFCAGLGLKRVVLARELSLKQVKEICRKTDIEIEVFIHGALCISYSGQCLFSSMLGGRSGNRGMCAQPCRLPYTFIPQEILQKEKEARKREQKRFLEKNKKGYLLSPKDLCTIEMLPEILAAGVHSLKIEGRMKSAQYVAVTVDAYRRTLDTILCKKKECDPKGENDTSYHFDQTEQARLRKNLMQVYNRGGFTQGHLGEAKQETIMSIHNVKNQGLRLGKVIAYNAVSKKLKLYLEEDISVGDGVELVRINGEDERHQIVASAIVRVIIVAGKPCRIAEKGSVAELGDIYAKERLSKDIKLGAFKTSDKNLETRFLEGVEDINKKKEDIYGEITIVCGQRPELKIWDDAGEMTVVREEIYPERASDRPLTEEKIIAQLQKTGDKPIRWKSLKVKTDHVSFLRIADLNKIRRDAIDQYLKEKMQKYKKETSELRSPDTIFYKKTENIRDVRVPEKNRNIKFALSIPNIPILEQCILHLQQMSGGDIRNMENGMSHIERCYLPLHEWLLPGIEKTIKRVKQCGIKMFVAMPGAYGNGWEGPVRGLLGEMPERIETLGTAKVLQGKKALLLLADGVLVSNPGQLEMMRALQKKESRYKGIEIVCNHNFNVFNSQSVKSFPDVCVTLSPEMNKTEIQHCIGRLSLQERERVSYICYGRVPLMYIKYCPVGMIEKGCGTCEKNRYVLRDRLGLDFPIISDKESCTGVILNSKILYIPEEIEALQAMGIRSFRIDIQDETPRQILKIIQAYAERRNIQGEKKDKYTRGHLYRGVSRFK